MKMVQDLRKRMGAKIEKKYLPKTIYASRKYMTLVSWSMISTHATNGTSK